MSTEIKAQNQMALASVKAIYDAADEATTLLDGMKQAAQDAGTTLDGIYQDAEDAKTAAETAQSSAKSALVDLSTIENVVGTLNWITAHGTMTSQAGGTFDPNKVYFIADPNGDYVVGGVHYSAVAEPVAEDIDNYYVLTVDESVQNYVATHIVVDEEGLWIIPDAGGNKVLIATGQGSTYTSAGTYIVGKVDGVDIILAQFTAGGTQIGQTDESHLEMNYHSMRLIARNETDPYLYISDLRSKHTSEDEYGEGFYYVADDQFDGDGTKKKFELSLVASMTNYKVYLNSELVTSGIKKYRDRVVFDTAPVGLIKAEYPSDNNNLKAYTLGHRDDNPSPGYYPKIGAMSVAEGIYIIASGRCTHAEGIRTSAIGEASHAEGYNTIASGTASHAEGGGPFSYKTEAKGTASHAEGWDATAFADCSHAEGRSTEANGEASHAQNRGTIANHADQTTIGRYNDNKSDTAFEIGNGTSSARSNSHDFTWDGNIRLALDTTATSGTDKEIYDALVGLGWDSDVIV